MVYNESDFLPVWMDYYHKSFNYEDMYIFDNCTSDGSITYQYNNQEKATSMRNGEILYERIPEHNLKCNVIRIWPGKQDFKVFDTSWIQTTLRYLYNILLNEYEYVIYTDADDFLMPNPEKYKNLKDYVQMVKNNNQDCARATGYEIIQLENEPDLEWNKPILHQRKNWMQYGMWSKTFITNQLLRWIDGFHFVIDNSDAPDPDLILCHLKRIDAKSFLSHHGETNLPAGFHSTFRKSSQGAGRQSKRKSDVSVSNIGAIEPIPDVWKDMF